MTTATADAILIATGGPTRQGGLADWFSKVATETLQDAERRWLVEQGASTGISNKGMWSEVLKAAGYVGTVDDMLHQYWVLEAGLEVPNPSTYLDSDYNDQAYIQTPNNAAWRPAGNWEIRVKWRHDWDASVTNRTVGIFSQFELGNINCQWRVLGSTGACQWYGTPDGTSFDYDETTDAGLGTFFSGEQLIWLRCTGDVTANELKFFYGTDGINWIQLGSTIEASPSPLFTMKDATLPLRLSGDRNGFVGGHECHYMSLHDGIGGPILLSFDASGEAGQSSFVSPEGYTWTKGANATLVDV